MPFFYDNVHHIEPFGNLVQKLFRDTKLSIMHAFVVPIWQPKYTTKHNYLPFKNESTCTKLDVVLLYYPQ